MIFLELEDVIATNEDVVNKFGGMIGIRDKTLIESAIANPRNLYFYQDADIYTLAASYAFSITRNHPFLDGNKRTGFATMYLFLKINGITIKCPTDESIEIMVKVATKEITIEQFSSWLKFLDPNRPKNEALN